MKRVGYYLCAPALCLALFWRVLFTWFRTDDFALLSLAASAHDLRSFAYASFHPVAQGTVRILSDRLFYQVCYFFFGVRAMPFHIVILLTWFAALGLAAEIGTRISGSRAGGLAAAMLWAANPLMVTPLAWAPAYDVVLCAFFALAALYARARWLEGGANAWRSGEWIFFVLGFGAQESMVMYPAAAILYTWAVARRNVFKKGERGIFLLFIPAILFAAAHFLLIPKQASGVYGIAIDGRLPATLWTYITMSLLRDPFTPADFLLRWIGGVALGGFLVWRLMRKDWSALFAGGWFVLWLVPVLPLPNHISEYYVTASLAGMAWLGGWLLVTAWRANMAARLASVAAVAFYLFITVPSIEAGTAWYLDHTSRMRIAFRAMQQLGREHPGSSVILKGVDNDLFQTGFQDRPEVLAGLSHLYLAPGSEVGIIAREDLGGVKSMVISPEDALAAIGNGDARVVDVSTNPAREITHGFETVLRADFLTAHRDFVDVGRPVYASQLGPGWDRIENGYRWMARSATVQLAGPSSPADRLYVTGYGPAALSSGPVRLQFRADGLDLGSATVTTPDRPFAFDFALPAKFVNQYSVDISIETNRTFQVANDAREFGMVFGTFSIR